MIWVALGFVVLFFVYKRRLTQHGHALYTIEGEKRYVFEFRGYMLSDSVYFAVLAEDLDEARFLVDKAAEKYAEEVGIRQWRCYPSSHEPTGRIVFVG